MGWSIKDMLQPVIARLFIYGMNPIELEHVFKALEEIPHNTGQNTYFETRH